MSKEFESLMRGVKEAGKYLRGEPVAVRETVAPRQRRNPTASNSLAIQTTLTVAEIHAIVMLLEDQQGRGASEIADTLGCTERDAESFLALVEDVVSSWKQTLIAAAD